MIDFMWLLSLAVIFLYLCYWYRRPSKFPPGPRGIPLLGYLPFTTGKRLHELAYKVSKQYGPILSIRLGPEDSVFLNDFESINKALVKQGSVFSGRPLLEPFETLKKGHGVGFADYGESWKSQRKFGIITLRGLGVGKKSMENICMEEVGYLNEEIRKKHGKVFNISAMLHKAVANNLCSVVFGKRFDYNDEKFDEMVLAVINAFDDPKQTTMLLVVQMASWLKNVFPFSYESNTFLDRLRVLFKWLEKNITEHQKTFDENNLRDFIDAFLREQKKGTDKFFTDFQLVNYLHDLFVAGTETTSSTLYWSLLCFLHFPETQKKLRQEVFDVLGSSGTVSMSKKAEMPYTNAFILEIYRFRTLAPLSVIHKTTADSELDGYFIPKDTKILANLWAVHNDPNLWKNPEKFIPERFLDDNRHFVGSNHVIPFSVGPRRCLGEQLAQMEIFIFLVAMVQKFEFLPDPAANELPTIDDGSPGLGFIPLAYEIVAKEI